MARTSEARKPEERNSEKKQSGEKSGNYVCDVCGNSISFDEHGRQHNEDLICCGHSMQKEDD